MRISLIFNSVLLCSVSLLIQSAAQADLVQFNEGTDANVLAASSTATGFSSSFLVLSDEFSGSATDFGGFNNGVFNRTSNNGGNGTISFTLANNSGTDFDLTSFSFTTTGQASGGAADAYQYTLQSQVDGVNVGPAFTKDVIGQVAGTTSTTPVDVVTTSLSQVLADGESAVFTVVSSSFQEVGNPSGSDGVAEALEIFRVTGFSVAGTAVAVPEPSSFALVGLGALAFIGRRRR